MKYQLSKYQLFNIFCNDRDYETCPYNEKNCTEEFYEYIESNYNNMKVEDN